MMANGLRLFARALVLLVDRQLQRHSERHTTRDDRDLVDRVGLRNLHPQQGMTRFVIGCEALLLSLMIILRRSAPIRTLSFAIRSRAATTFWLCVPR